MNAPRQNQSQKQSAHGRKKLLNWSDIDHIVLSMLSVFAVPLLARAYSWTIKGSAPNQGDVHGGRLRMPHWATILLCGAFGTGMLLAILLLARLEPIEDPAVQLLLAVFGVFYLLAFAGCYSALDPNWDTMWDAHSIEGCSKKTTIRPGKFRSAISGPMWPTFPALLIRVS